MTAGQLDFYPAGEQPDPLLCWLWLARTLGYASPCAGRVLETFGDAQTAWERDNNLLASPRAKCISPPEWPS